VAPGFSPLDDELALLPGRLTPRLHEWVVRLATWMPFAATTDCLAWLARTTLSPATAQRLTTAAGQAAVTVQTAAAAQLAHDLPSAPCAPARLVVSIDGAMVPVRGDRPWREVKTMVIGEPVTITAADGTAIVQTQDLSYCSRMTDATTFADLALVETHRRGLHSTGAVAAVTDGAAWIQGFLDLHCPDAVRILDFPHASGYLAQLGDLVFGASSSASHAWQDTQRQQLKTLGAVPVLGTISGLTERATDADAFATAQQYLTQRQGHMDYPAFQAAGWPIGSGMVESANKLVVEARMKGSGMHWDGGNVNGMLALRNAVCNDRWDGVWAAICSERRTAAQRARWERQQQRRPTPPPAPSAEAAPHLPTTTHLSAEILAQIAEPPRVHPWRRAFSRRRQIELAEATAQDA
jgi:hypothetical protein